MIPPAPRLARGTSQHTLACPLSSPLCSMTARLQTYTGTLDAAAASATKSTTLTIPGTGTANVTVDGTTVTKNFNVLAPDMTVTSTHTGNFHPGDTADTYTLTATTAARSSPTARSRWVDTLPAGFTATALTGAGGNWSCTLATLTCTNSVNTAAVSASLPAITLTVSNRQQRCRIVQ